MGGLREREPLRMNPGLPAKVKRDGGDKKRCSLGQKMSSVWNMVGVPEVNWPTTINIYYFIGITKLLITVVESVGVGDISQRKELRAEPWCRPVFKRLVGEG